MKEKNEFPRRKDIIYNSGVKKPLVAGERDHSCREKYHFLGQIRRNDLGAEIV